MPLENVTVAELEKAFNGNALDNEVAQFEKGLPTESTTSKGTTEVDKTEQQTNSENNKLGEKDGEGKVSTTNNQTEDKSKVEVKPTVNIKDFDAAIGSNLASLKTATKVEDKSTKVIEDVKTEDKTADAENKVELDAEGKPIRDLEGYGEQEKKWLQRMPYDGYKHFSAIIKEKKELENKYKTEKETLVNKITNLEAGKQVLPESYYENPNAFILSPEFGKIQSHAQLAKTVENHWVEQLRKFKKGESWTPLTNDPKTGEVVMDEDREYNADDEVYILRQLSGAEKQASNFQDELKRFVIGFQETHKSYITKIRQAEKEMLPTFENKESQEYKTYQNIIPNIEKMGIRRDNPAFDFLAKAVALNLVFRDALVSMLAEKNKTTTLKEEQRKAGPNQSSFSGGGSSANNNNGKKEPAKFSDFNKILQGDVF